jgi:hypothetical protein
MVLRSTSGWCAAIALLRTGAKIRTPIHGGACCRSGPGAEWVSPAIAACSQLVSLTTKSKRTRSRADSAFATSAGSRRSKTCLRAMILESGPGQGGKWESIRGNTPRGFVRGSELTPVQPYVIQRCKRYASMSSFVTSEM